MPRKLFTDEEVEQLLSNPYTRSCSPTTIKFTDEFYDTFWRKYLENAPLKEIWISLGYDPDVLGIKRIEGVIYTLRRNKLTDEQRADSISRNSTVKRPPEGTDYTSMATKDAVKAIHTELTYLRQELEFLKKISSVGKQNK